MKIACLGLVVGSLVGVQSVRADDKKVAGSLALTVPQALAQFNPPAGYSTGHLAPPVGLKLRFGFDNFGAVKNSGLDAAFEAKAAFTRYSQKPFYGFDFGLGTAINKLRISGGVEWNTQGSINKAPYENSPTDLWIYGVRAAIGFADEWYSLSIGLRDLFTSKASAGKFESIQTDIGREQTYIYSANVDFRLSILRLSTSASLYQLPNVAVLSEDFAFGLPEKSVYRFMAAAGIALGDVEIWAKHYWVTSVTDVLGQFYRAPFLMDDYLLASRVAAVEVKWHF